jgi:hypothetical protein
MINVVIPILLVLAAVGIFFGFVDSGYERVVEQRAEVARYDEALRKTEELLTLRDELNATYKSFSQEDIDRLFAMLPDHVDNVKLGLDLDALAETHDLELNQLMLLSEGGSNVKEGEEESKKIEVGSTILTFSLKGTYTGMQAFLTDLEKNLRVLDVVEVSFGGTSRDQVVGSVGTQTYDISARIYWLK